ncbi:hypothetical protein RMN57_03980 [Kitasatospora sp. CM 4170]|uniref:Nucleotide exchange factor GrpE n=1 Tax=Kitasatospora aburaviensis TaxID=67265 RepID=A0ABW1FA77_9ACTN|nr:hypothetical protein [Kitasatospora sp. CM 4170]WNM43922.1 hypothetical protein RMN57_03980 [Kitasatospora sp. CM 4170]
MSTDDKGNRDENDASREDDGTVRERSAEERSITAPTPKDVRAKGDDLDEEAEPPAADTQAP